MDVIGQFPEETSGEGEFERQEDAFRDRVSTDGSTPCPVEPGRYHLYGSLACPWAHWTVIVRRLKGLESAIGLTVVDPVRDERGWAGLTRAAWRGLMGFDGEKRCPKVYSALRTVPVCAPVVHLRRLSGRHVPAADGCSDPSPRILAADQHRPADQPGDACVAASYFPAGAAPSGLQVLLLDGSWPEAARMTQTVAPWGRLVRLPLAGPSRYWLRAQPLEGNYSTIESLLFLLAALGLAREEAQLRLQFELHVYAGLRARGHKVAAAEYLATSPVREAFPALLRQLDQGRPLV